MKYWVIGVAVSIIVTAILTVIFPIGPLVAVSLIPLFVLVTRSWVRSTLRAYRLEQPSPLHESIIIRHSNVSPAERNMLLRYLFSPDPANPKVIEEEVLVMTKRDTIYFILKAVGIVSIGCFTAGAAIILGEVVDHTPALQTRNGVNWVQIGLIVLAGAAFWALGEVEMDERTMVIVLIVFFIGYLVVRSSLDMQVVIPVIALLASLVALLWVWLEWRSWYFVCTVSRAYIARRYPAPWAWLGDHKKRLRLRTVDEVDLSNPWWSRLSGLNIGIILLEGPSQENVEFKKIAWLPNADLVVQLLDSTIERRER
jgi:hypothetical protein